MQLRIVALNLVAIFALCNSVSAQVSFASLAAQPPDNVVSIAVDPTTGDTYAATSGKVIKSTDAGVTWTSLANPHAAGINTLYFTPTGKLYAGVDATNKVNITDPSVGLVSYDRVIDVWSPVGLVQGAPLNVTALIQDASGNLIAGTGTTGNFRPMPINYGTGIYLYNGSSWSAVNTGIPTIPTFSGPSVLPYVKQFIRDTSGRILAATYGSGVLIYNASSSVWSPYGAGLTTLNVNALTMNMSGTVYAGLDSGVAYTNGIGWTTSSNGLPSEPVRALAVDSSGKLFAGLGFYPWMDGNLGGDIYTSANNGSLWQKSGMGYAASDVLSISTDLQGNAFVGTAGVWKSADAGATWAFVRSANVGAGKIFDIAKNSKGDLFAISDNSPQYFGYGGIFRSIDDGATWTQIISGIGRHRGNFIFCDSKDNLWAGLTRMDGAASNASHTNGALYKSTDNGNTWVQNTSILVPSLKFVKMAESSSGKLYLGSGFGSPSNISSSSDYETWNNTLNGGSNNGGLAYGLAINSNNDVFLGTETQGVKRSLNDGTGAFSTVGLPGGNDGVFVDPYSGFIFEGNTGDANGLWMYGSVPSDNGSNPFQFSNLPSYTNARAMVFDNRGNFYMAIQSGNFANAGLYTSASPWTSSSMFAKVMRNGNLSYYFSNMIVDKCGYIYGAQSGAGVYRSASSVNIPSPPTLQSPSNGATAVSPAVTLTWMHSCSLDSFRIQIATDSGFQNVAKDVAVNSSTIYTTMGSPLSSNTTYYWRISASNAAGVSAWTSPSSFTTGVLPDLVFKSGFDG